MRTTRTGPIIIRDLQGETLKHRVAFASSTVEELFSVLEEKDLSLLHEGKILSPKKTLIDCGVPFGATLQLCRRNRRREPKTDEYKGEKKDGKKHGQGTMTWRQRKSLSGLSTEKES